MIGDEPAQIRNDLTRRARLEVGDVELIEDRDVQFGKPLRLVIEDRTR